MSDMYIFLLIGVPSNRFLKPNTWLNYNNNWVIQSQRTTLKIYKAIKMCH